MQPVMGPVFQTRHLGDILISSGKKVRGLEKFPWKDFYQFLREYWAQKGKEIEPGLTPEDFLAKGPGTRRNLEGIQRSKAMLFLKGAFLLFLLQNQRTANADQLMDVTIYPTIQFFDGREANRPWIQELARSDDPDYLGRLAGDPPGNGPGPGDPKRGYPFDSFSLRKPGRCRPIPFITVPQGVTGHASRSGSLELRPLCRWTPGQSPVIIFSGRRSRVQEECFDRP